MSDPRGLVFEDCEVGSTFESDPRTLTQAEIEQFAELSGDHNPVHVDAEFARRSVFRGCVAHGMLVQSIASGMMWSSHLFAGTVIAVAEAKSEFLGPVRAGDELRAQLKILEREAEPSTRRGWVKWGVSLRNQRDEVVMQSEWKLVVARRPAK